MTNLPPLRWALRSMGLAPLVLAPALLAAPAARPQGNPDAEARAAMALLRMWQNSQTAYHLRMVTRGQFIESTSDMWCYPLPNGRIWKTEVQIQQPNETHFIIEESPTDLVAYFPDSKLHVATRIKPTYIDLVSPNLQGLSDEDQVFKVTKSRSVSRRGALQELKLVFDAFQLGISPPTADVTVLLRYDEAGQIHEVEQQRLGLSQVTSLTYITFDEPTVKATTPVTPDPALADTKKTFEEAIQEDILFHRTVQRASAKPHETTF
jgi:hypothetical protein